MPSRSTRLISIASATACWIARSVRTMGSLGCARGPAARRSVRSALPSGADSTAVAHAPSPGARGGRPRAPPAVAVRGQEDQEAVGAHRVEADDVARRQARRSRGARAASPRTRAPPRRRPPSRAWSRASPSVRGRGRRRRPCRCDLEQPAHVLDDRGQRGQAGERVEELALEAEPLRAQPVVVGSRSSAARSPTTRGILGGCYPRCSTGAILRPLLPEVLRMPDRPLRLGDVIDDYCPRCRLLLNHDVGSLTDGEVAKVTCRTCYNTHDYRHAQVPDAPHVEEGRQARASWTRSSRACPPPPDSARGRAARSPSTQAARPLGRGRAPQEEVGQALCAPSTSSSASATAPS